MCDFRRGNFDEFSGERGQHKFIKLQVCQVYQVMSKGKCLNQDSHDLQD